MKKCLHYTAKDLKKYQEYSYRWDAYFCKACGGWLETGCDDPECEFCTKRPERAFEPKKEG